MDEAESQRKKSDLALVIGGSIAGSFLALWCGNWLLKWAFQTWEHMQRKKALRAMLATSRVLLDPVQQRIVNETVQQRCEAVSASGRLQAYSSSRTATSTLPATRAQDRNNVNIERRSVGAHATGRVLAPRSEVLAETSAIWSAPSSESVYLPRERLSEVSFRVNASSRNDILSNNKQQYVEVDTTQQLVRNHSDGENSLSECSDSSDATSSSNEGNDMNSTDGSMYSFPSSLTDGADLC